MQQSSATPSLHLDFWGLRKIVACSPSSSQCLLVPTVFGTVSSLHPISFLMIFILVHNIVEPVLGFYILSPCLPALQQSPTPSCSLCWEGPEVVWTNSNSSEEQGDFPMPCIANMGLGGGASNTSRYVFTATI